MIMIATQRLMFKKFSAADAQGFYELNLDPEVIRYTGDMPFLSIAEAEAFILSYDHYDRHGYGRWSVFLNDSSEYIGFCGLNYSQKKMEVDVGFRFIRAHWGKGYATEAARASLQHGFNEYGLDRIVGRAMKENAASLRVLEKLGMRFQKEFDEEGAVWVQYQIARQLA
jgi:RimJ/RimL family protein N-acetyltransferase